MDQAKAAVDKLCGSQSGNSENPAMPTVVPGQTAPVSGPPKLPEPNLDSSAIGAATSAIKITSDNIRLQGVNDVMIKTAVDDVATSIQCVRSKMDNITGNFNQTMTDTLGFIHSSTDQFKSMILNMAVSLQTGLSEAASSVVPASAIAQLVTVANDINNVVSLISEVQTSITAFTDFPKLQLGGIENLLEIPNLDMELTPFVMPEIASLRSEVEQVYSSLRVSGKALSSLDELSLSNAIGFDPSSPTATPPSSCP
jgi:hypothetical protein